ncbi:MAG: hypothetical protein HC837_00530 [Chloroflexaceae bacterium]|nr:hypothetical protein [Chloroflexaceae bacterium]
MLDAVSGTLVGGIELGVGMSGLLIGQLTLVLGLAEIWMVSSLYAFGMGVLVIYLNVTREQPTRRTSDPQMIV